MKKTFKTEDIDEMMTQADTLLKQFDSERVKDMEYVHRAQIEKDVHHLNTLKTEFQAKKGKADNPEGHSYGDGIHAAIEDIAKAMKGLARYLS